MGNADFVLRPFGAAGPSVTPVGLGGEGILRTYGEDEGASAVIDEAVAAGIRYFDCAQAYAGSEDYYGHAWGKSPQDRALVFQAGKSASRSRSGALTHLENTLRRMKIDHLDMWQIHDVRTEKDLEEISGPGGALGAFLQAKAEGKARFIGVTGHHDPDILTRAVEQWPVDAVMMPVNPVEGALGGFFDNTLPAALNKGIAVIGMKVLGASHYIIPEARVTPEILIRYALSQPISVAIVGCSTASHVRTLANAGRSFSPMSEADQKRLIELFKPHAQRLAFYRGVI